MSHGRNQPQAMNINQKTVGADHNKLLEEKALSRERAIAEKAHTRERLKEYDTQEIRRRVDTVSHLLKDIVSHPHPA